MSCEQQQHSQFVPRNIPSNKMIFIINSFSYLQVLWKMNWHDPVVPWGVLHWLPWLLVNTLVFTLGFSPCDSNTSDNVVFLSFNPNTESLKLDAWPKSTEEPPDEVGGEVGRGRLLPPPPKFTCVLTVDKRRGRRREMCKSVDFIVRDGSRRGGREMARRFFTVDVYWK